jgi:hypothetical protein
MLTRLALLAALVGASLSAQFPTVVPSNLVVLEGGGASEAPGDWHPLHMQSIYNNSVISTGGLITRLDYRRDGSNTAFVAHSKQVTLWLSSAGVDLPEWTSAHFAYNRGSDHQQVFTGTVNYPAEPPVTMPPAMFTLQLQVMPSFFLPTGANLLVEMAVQGTTFAQAGWRGDSTAALQLAPEGNSAPSGNPGCPLTFTDNFLGNRPWPGAPLVLQSPSGATAALPGVSILGIAFPAPIDLSFLGAPGCALVQNLDAMLPVVSDAAGVIVSDWGKLPKSGNLRGRLINLQTVLVDPTFNTLAIRVSEGVVLTLGQGFPAGLEAHSWYNRRDNTAGLSPRADFRSSRAPVIQLN